MARSDTKFDHLGSLVRLYIGEGRRPHGATGLVRSVYPGPNVANFYLAFPEAGAGGTVVAKDGSGAVIETDVLETCRPPSSLASSCGHRAPDGHGE